MSLSAAIKSTKNAPNSIFVSCFPSVSELADTVGLIGDVSGQCLDCAHAEGALDKASLLFVLWIVHPMMDAIISSASGGMSSIDLPGATGPVRGRAYAANACVRATMSESQKGCSIPGDDGASETVLVIDSSKCEQVVVVSPICVHAEAPSRVWRSGSAGSRRCHPPGAGPVRPG